MWQRKREEWRREGDDVDDDDNDNEISINVLEFHTDAHTPKHVAPPCNLFTR